MIDTAIKSVTGDTPIVVIENGVSKYVEIGPWIDAKLAESENVRFYPKDRNMEFLELSDSVFVPTGDGKGNTSWGAMTAVTRHDPGEAVYKVTTNSGRYVTVADSESLLVWNGDAFEKKHSSLLRIGDKVPVASRLSRPPSIIESIDMQQYFPKNKYIYGTDFNKATQLMKQAQGDKFHIPRKWWEATTETLLCCLTQRKRASPGQLPGVQTPKTLSTDVCIPFTRREKACRFPDRLDLNRDNGIFVGLF